MKKDIDLTEGPVFKKILAFSLPLALGFLLQNLYTLCDSLIVSLSRGKDAVTGINITGSFVFLVTGFAQGAASGFGIVLSRFAGAKDETKMRRSFATSIFLSVFMGVILTVIMLLSAHSVLLTMGTDPSFISYSEKYVKNLFSGIIFTLLYNLSDQVLRSVGDSRTPLFILISCTFLNVLLNSLLFITDLPAEWTGLTTVICQGVAAAICFAVIYKKYGCLHLKKADFKLNPAFIAEHLKTGLPMAFEFTITAVSCMIQQRAFNTLDDPKYAMAQGTGSRIDNFFNSLIFGSANSFAVYCGQNYGAKKTERIREGARSGLLLGLIASSLSYVLAISLCRPLSRILLYNAEETVYDLVFTYISTQSLFYFFLFVLVMYRQCLQGLDKSPVTVLGGAVELAMRITAAVLFAKFFGYKGACFSNPLAWLGAAIFYTATFVISLRKIEKKISAEKELPGNREA